MTKCNASKEQLNLNKQIQKIEQSMKLFFISSRYEDSFMVAELKTLLHILENSQNNTNTLPLEERLAKIIFDTFFDCNQIEPYKKNAGGESLKNHDINTQIGFSFMDFYYKEKWNVKWFCKSFFDYTHFNYKRFVREKFFMDGEYPDCPVFDDYKDFSHFFECYLQKKGILKPGEEYPSSLYERLEKKAMYEEEFEISAWEDTSIFPEISGVEIFNGEYDAEKEKEEEIYDKILDETFENVIEQKESLDTIIKMEITRIKKKTFNAVMSKDDDPKSIIKFGKILDEEGLFINQQYKEFKSYIDKGIFKDTCPRDCNYLESKTYFEETLKLLDRTFKKPLELLNESKTLRNFLFISPRLVQNTLEYICQELKIPPIDPSRIQENPLFELENTLHNLISLSDSKHEKWVNKYKHMNKVLNERFPLRKDLTHREYEILCEDLKKFRKEYSKKTLKTILDKPWISNAYHHAIDSHLLNFIRTLKEKGSTFNDITAKLYVSYALDHTTIPDSDGRKEAHYLKKAIKLDKNNLDAYHALAKCYEKISDREKALETWAQLVKHYFTKIEKKDFEKHGNSTNEVGKIKSYFFEDLILKKSEQDLSQEYNITEFIYNQAANKELTSEPIALIKEPDGTSYIILRRADSSRTLGDEMRYLSKIKGNKSAFSRIKWISKDEVIDNFKLDYFKKVIDSLVKIHETGKGLEEQINQYDYDSKLKTKLEELFPKKKDKIYKSCSFLIDYLKKLPQQFGHCDFYPENILVIDSKTKDSQFNRITNEFCTIDYEKSSKVNKYFDLTYLLEQAQLELSQEVKEDLIKHFKEKTKDPTPLEEIMKIYNHNALFINLSLAGTSSKWAYKGEEYTERKEKYLNQAEKVIDHMEKEYSMCLKDLKEVLK